MGSVVNPVSYRLGWCLVWNFIWSTHSLNINYSYLFTRDFYYVEHIKFLLQYFLFHPRYSLFSDYWLVSSFRLIRFMDKVMVFCFYNDAFLEWGLDVFIMTAFYKKSRFFKGYKLNRLFRLNRFNVIFLELFCYSYFKKIYWLNFTTSVSYLLSLCLQSKVQLKLIRWVGLDVTANGVAWFVCSRLRRFQSLNSVLKVLFILLNKFLIKKGHIIGYKIMYKGRFFRIGRRGKATCVWKSRGCVPTSTVTSFMSYSALRVRLVYSTCSFKIWLIKKTI